jgi:hypothetical protein
MLLRRSSVHVRFLNPQEDRQPTETNVIKTRSMLKCYWVKIESLECNRRHFIELIIIAKKLIYSPTWHDDRFHKIPVSKAVICISFVVDNSLMTIVSPPASTNACYKGAVNKYEMTNTL